MRAVAGPVSGPVAQVLLLRALAGTVGLGAAGVGCRSRLRRGPRRGAGTQPLRDRSERLGPAGWVTLARATLAVGVAALTADSFDRDAPVATLVALSAVALVLDYVDGQVARRTGTASRLRRALGRRGRRVPDPRPQRLRRPLGRRLGARDRRGALSVPRGRVAVRMDARAAAAARLAPGCRGDAGDHPDGRRGGRPAAGADAGRARRRARPARRVVRPRRLVAVAPPARSPTVARARPPAAAGLGAHGHRRGAHASSPSLLVWAALVAPNEPSRLTPARSCGSRSRVSSSSRSPSSCLAPLAACWHGWSGRRSACCCREAPRHRLLHGLRPAVQPCRRLELHRASASRRCATRSVGRSANLAVAGVGAARRRRARPHDPGGASPDPGRGRPPPACRSGPSRRSASSGCSAGRSARSSSPVRRSPPRAPRPGDRRGPRGACRRQDHALRRRDPPTTASAHTPGDQLLTGLRGKDVLLVFVESYGKVAVEGSSLSPGSMPCSTRGPSSCGPPASPPGAPSSPRRPSAASAGWRTPRCSPGCGSTTSSATTSCRERSLHAQPGLQARRVADRRRRARRTTGTGRRDVVLPLRPGLRPAPMSDTAARASLRDDARPVRALGPPAPRAGEARPPLRSWPRSISCRATRRGRACRR